MRILNIIFAALLIATFDINAQWNEGDDRAPVSDNAWRASSGDFGAMLLITNDPEGFFKQWNRPPSPDYKPSMTTVSTAVRGDTVMAIILFSGCKSEKNGNCNSEVDFRVNYPDGKVYAVHQGGELWKNKTAPIVGTLQASVSNLGFKVEMDDPFGLYNIEAIVRDNITGKQLKIFRSIHIIESKTK